MAGSTYLFISAAILVRTLITPDRMAALVGVEWLEVGVFWRSWQQAAVVGDGYTYV